MLTLRSPSGTLFMVVATQVTMMVVVTTTLTVTLSLASEPKPIPGTLTGTPLWRGTLVMGLTRLNTRWKGSNDLSIGWMTLHMCKQRCKPPSTHKPAWCMTSSITLGLTLMLKSCKDLSLGRWWVPKYEFALVSFRSQLLQLSRHLSCLLNHYHCHDCH
jgi:hypothetical protein